MRLPRLLRAPSEPGAWTTSPSTRASSASHGPAASARWGDDRCPPQAAALMDTGLLLPTHESNYDLLHLIQIITTLTGLARCQPGNLLGIPRGYPMSQKLPPPTLPAVGPLLSSSKSSFKK